jgi:hypothetical protein
MIQVVASAELFWGFSISLPNEVSTLSIEEQSSIVNAEMKHQLSAFFLSRNLQLLKEKVDLLTLHLHGPLKHYEKNYACDHIHN